MKKILLISILIFNGASLLSNDPDWWIEDCEQYVCDGDIAKRKQFFDATPEEVARRQSVIREEYEYIVSLLYKGYDRSTVRSLATYSRMMDIFVNDGRALADLRNGMRI